MDPQPIILFDGDCAYCNSWVRWISVRDRAKRYRFVALTSEEGVALRKQHGVPAHIDSIVLIDRKTAHVRSDAAWRVLGALPGWGAAATLLRLVPRPIRNWGYDLVARNRHRLGGQDACELP